MLWNVPNDKFGKELRGYVCLDVQLSSQPDRSAFQVCEQRHPSVLRKPRTFRGRLRTARRFSMHCATSGSTGRRQSNRHRRHGQRLAVRRPPDAARACLRILRGDPRFEFALKEEGYLHLNRFGRVAPNWDEFSDSMEEALAIQHESALDDAIDFLTVEPPQVQTGACSWSNVPLRGAGRVAQALDAVQRVRHNLFHGGKHTPHSPPGRDERLVRSSLLVLHGCLSADRNLQETYEQHFF